jgi:glycosyltransferase involved in cell wall biosynthesis
MPASVVMACSEAVAREQRRIRPRRRVEVVHPPVDLERFARRDDTTSLAFRAQLGVADGAPLIGMVARLQRWKGVHVFIDAMTEVVRRHPNAMGVVVGGAHHLEPDYEARLVAQIAQLGLGERVRLAGFQADVPQWVSAFDVAVHASDDEPFGMVVIEAMALGKPVAAAASGGVVEIIEHGRTGLLSPFGDASALATHILCYLDEPEFARDVGARAAVRAADFAVERCVQQLIHVMRSTVDMD